MTVVPPINQHGRIFFLSLSNISIYVCLYLIFFMNLSAYTAGLFLYLSTISDGALDMAVQTVWGIDFILFPLAMQWGFQIIW